MNINKPLNPLSMYTCTEVYFNISSSRLFSEESQFSSRHVFSQCTREIHGAILRLQLR